MMSIEQAAPDARGAAHSSLRRGATPMRERRTFGQWFADARPRLVPAGCAVALFAVTALCLLAVIAPNLRVLLGSATSGGANSSATATAATTSGQDYTLILPTAPTTAI